MKTRTFTQADVSRLSLVEDYVERNCSFSAMLTISGISTSSREAIFKSRHSNRVVKLVAGDIDSTAGFKVPTVYSNPVPSSSSNYDYYEYVETLQLKENETVQELASRIGAVIVSILEQEI